MTEFKYVSPGYHERLEQLARELAAPRAGRLASIEAYKTPVVTEIKPEPPKPPGYNQPNSDALAA